MVLSIKKALILILGLVFVIGAIASPTLEKRSEKSTKKPSKDSTKNSKQPSTPQNIPPPDTSTDNPCRSFTDNFQKARIVDQKNYNGDPSSADWIDTCGVAGTYKITSSGVEANVLKPSDPQRTYSKEDGGYYNKNLGEGMSWNSTYKMHYGTVSVVMKTCGVGGHVAALVLMASDGDEIDWECVGKDTKHAQSNYFFDRILVYGVNGGVHTIPKNGAIDTDYHTYTIKWSPDAIEWCIDGQTVRTLKKQDTLKNGTYRFPNHPSYIQMGVWDGSGAAGTANWSNGPIMWNKEPSKLTTYIKEISIQCDPKWNKVIN